MSNRYSPVRPLLFLAAGTMLLFLGVIFRGTLAASPWLEYAVFGAAYLVAGWNVLAGAARSIVRGRVFDENFLMTVATGGAFAIHQLWEAVAVMIFYKVGEILEDLSVDRSRPGPSGGFWSCVRTSRAFAATGRSSSFGPSRSRSGRRSR